MSKGTGKQSGSSDDVRNERLDYGYEMVGGAMLEGWPHLMRYESEDQWRVENDTRDYSEECADEWRVDHYGPPFEGMVSLEQPPEGNPINKYGISYDPFDRPSNDVAAKAKAVAAPRRSALRNRGVQTPEVSIPEAPERSFPANQVKVLIDDETEGPYVKDFSRLVSFSDSKVLHFRHCGAVRRNLSKFLMVHEFDHCACLERLYLRREVIRDSENGIHGFLMCAHIKGNRLQQKYFRPCRSCLHIPKLY